MSLADKCLHPISPFDRELHFNAVNISQIFNFSSQIQPFAAIWKIFYISSQNCFLYNFNQMKIWNMRIRSRPYPVT